MWLFSGKMHRTLFILVVRLGKWTSCQSLEVTVKILLEKCNGNACAPLLPRKKCLEYKIAAFVL